MIFILICLILFIPYLLLLLWSRHAWQRLKATPDSGARTENPFISIIIPARNEENNIGPCLQSVLNQSYPAERYEIIVVDDHSSDNTAERVLAIQDRRIRLIRLQEVIGDRKTLAYKKMAIAAAVEAARGELILTTDADCLAQPGWLSAVAGCYLESRADIIVMPVRIRCGNNPLAVFETLDFLSLQGMTGALVSRGKINMANGANLCYSKKIYDRVNGFEGIDHIASGDDMLFVEKARTAGAVIFYLKNRDVIVETHASADIGSFLRQRIRWASKSAGYKDKRIQWVLLLVYLLNLSLAALAIRGFAGCDCRLNEWGEIRITTFFWMLLAVKTIGELRFLFPVAGFFGQRRLLWYFPLAQLPHMIYIVMSGLLGLFGGYEWKGRKVK